MLQPVPARSEKDLKLGFQQLDALAQSEYKVPVTDILQDPDPEHAALRLGRLVGVMLKEPFAKAVDVTQPSFRTGAYREWHLVDEPAFQQQGTASWQYKALAEMQRELSQTDTYIGGMKSVYQLAVYAQHETGFFGFFALSLRKYICGDPKIRTQISDDLKQLKTSGVPNVTPESVVGAGGLSLGAYLVHVAPLLGMVGAPVIAALVVILYRLGVDAFCNWTTTLHAQIEQT